MHKEMDGLRVLMQMRANAFTCPGGDTVQMQKTRAALEAMGCRTALSLELRPDLSGYDLVHLFNLTRVQETYMQMQNAVGQNKPVVLSTIYWPNAAFEKQGGIGVRRLLGRALTLDQMESLKALAKFLLLGDRDEGTRFLITHSYQKMQRYILEHADVFLPNAKEEMRQIQTQLQFAAPEGRVVVVPNAVDTQAVQKAAQSERPQYEKYRDWLICVGRIDSRKNQLKLLEAIRGTGYRLLLVGKCSPGQKAYYKKVMAAIRDDPYVAYIEQLPNEELYHLYKVCRVSVLPSWFETPGLVSLEAAAMHCNVVLSDRGTTRDYFGDAAYYCDVTDSASIRQQIEQAYAAPFDRALSEKIMAEYTWDAAAKATLRGYALALEGRA